MGNRQIVRHALRESADAQAARESEQARRETQIRPARPVVHDCDRGSDEDWAGFDLPAQ